LKHRPISTLDALHLVAAAAAAVCWLGALPGPRITSFILLACSAQSRHRSSPPKAAEYRSATARTSLERHPLIERDKISVKKEEITVTQESRHRKDRRRPLSAVSILKTGGPTSGSDQIPKGPPAVVKLGATASLCQALTPLAGQANCGLLRPESIPFAL
jgi:hypothetical protein